MILFSEQLSFYSYQSSVTFSGFLNALDGVASGEERIVFMTTNHVGKLDPALIRPGRVDLSQLVDDASSSQAKQLFSQFYADVDDVDTLAEELEHLVSNAMHANRYISMAALQGLFIKSTAREAVATCSDLFVNRKAAKM